MKTRGSFIPCVGLAQSGAWRRVLRVPPLDIHTPPHSAERGHFWEGLANLFGTPVVERPPEVTRPTGHFRRSFNDGRPKQIRQPFPEVAPFCGMGRGYVCRAGARAKPG